MNNKLKLTVKSVLAIFCTFAVALSVVSLSACSGDQKKADGNNSLSIGLVLAPTNLDIRRTSGVAVEQILLDNVYQTLFTLDENAVPQPNLCVESLVSEDQLTWNFTIKPGIKFSNGDEASAKDMAASIQSVIDDKLLGYKNLQKVESVSAENDILTIKLSSVDPELKWTLSGRAGVLYPANLSSDDAKTTAIGTGPYVVKDYDGKSLLNLEENANYWDVDRKPKTPKVAIHYLADSNAGFSAFQSGEIDILAPINEKLSTAIQSDSKYKFEVGEGSDKFELAFNNKSDKLKSLKVRQALRHAINHDEFISQRGVADIQLGGPITKLEPGFEDLTSLYPYDAEKAKNLLKEENYSADHPLELTLDYPAEIYGSELGQILTSQFSAVGINLTVNSVDFATWLKKVYTDKDYELTIVDNNEPRHFYNWANPDYYYQYDSAEVQKLYEQSLNATSEAEESELLAKAAKQVSQDAAADWLFNYRTTTALVSGVSGFRANFNQSRLPLSQITVEK